MTIEQFREWAMKCGWTPDTYGHLHQGEYRFKVQAVSVRLERGYHTPDTAYSKGEKRWVKLRGGYLSKLTVSADNKLQGMK